MTKQITHEDYKEAISILRAVRRHVNFDGQNGAILSRVYPLLAKIDGLRANYMKFDDNPPQLQRAVNIERGEVVVFDAVANAQMMGNKVYRRSTAAYRYAARVTHIDEAWEARQAEDDYGAADTDPDFDGDHDGGGVWRDFNPFNDKEI